MYTVITENDESEWEDQTGVLYHFPKRYAKYLEPGTKVIYYKGKIKNIAFRSNRLTDAPHYFAIAKIGNTYPDQESKKGDLFATIIDFAVFNQPILAKKHGDYLEQIPESKKTNYWRDGVRPIDKEIFEAITRNIPNLEIIKQKTFADLSLLNDLDNSLESSQEGQLKTKFVTMYERDPKLRLQAIAIHGSSCAACGFNFSNFYGEYAEGFIHIHHIVPISDFGGSRTVNPETDLVPLCANCHSVVHRKKDKTLTVNDLKDLITKASISKTKL